MTEIKNIEASAIKFLSAANPTAEAIFMALSLRERKQSETNLATFRRYLVGQGFKINETDFMNTFKTMESLGTGSVIYGRKGNSSRFKWNFSLKDVATLAFDNKEEVEKKVEAVHQEATLASAGKPKRGRPVGFKVKAKRGRPAVSKNKVQAKSTEVKVTPAPRFIGLTRSLYVSLTPGRNVQIAFPKNFTSEEVSALSSALRAIAKAS